MSIPFINNPTIPPAPPPTPPTPVIPNLWDSAARYKHMLLGKIKTVQFHLGQGAVAAAAVYVECVIDDHGDGTKNFGQYNVGDKVSCIQLGVTINGASIKIVNHAGKDIRLPIANGGIIGVGDGTFLINAANAHKYNIICFANHTPLPTIPS